MAAMEQQAIESLEKRLGELTLLVRSEKEEINGALRLMDEEADTLTDRVRHLEHRVEQLSRQRFQ